MSDSHTRPSDFWLGLLLITWWTIRLPFCAVGHIAAAAYDLIESTGYWYRQERQASDD